MADMQVTLIDHMGSDLSVVNAARVSMAKQSQWADVALKRLSLSDGQLLAFLARGMSGNDFDILVDQVLEEEDRAELIKSLQAWRNTPTHWSPFAHATLSFHCKAPLFVARQLQKSVIGLAWNEVSRRYVDNEPEFYIPNVWRKRASDKKQGSSDEAVKADWPDAVLFSAQLAVYKRMLELDVCPEQARMVLPQSMMTEWVWTGTLYAFARMCMLRLDRHTQKETRDIAGMFAEHIAEQFPASWQALSDGVYD